MKQIIPFGTTEPYDFALRNRVAGEMVAFDGTGFVVTLEIKKRVSNVMTDVETPPTVAWLSQSGGTVRVSGHGGLSVGNYYVRFKVTDGASKFGFFPNGDKADHWQVAAVAAP